MSIAFDSDTYRLINYLERLNIDKLHFKDGPREVVHPDYLLASDRDRIVALLKADTTVSRPNHQPKPDAAGDAGI
jgi:hypothetical protein